MPPPLRPQPEGMVRFTGTRLPPSLPQTDCQPTTPLPYFELTLHGPIFNQLDVERLGCAAKAILMGLRSVSIDANAEEKLRFATKTAIGVELVQCGYDCSMFTVRALQDDGADKKDIGEWEAFQSGERRTVQWVTGPKGPPRWWVSA